ncbi:MAG: cation:proton antiporter [bacterium]|nr:cation:proton antiporter [bacterium]
MPEQIFTELSIIIVVTAAVAGMAKLLKQPMIIAYILAGLVLSPYGLNIVNSHIFVGTLSQLGIAFLLFMVGLNLSPRVIKTVGKISIITGLGQIFFTSSIGLGIALLFNFSVIEAIYIAIALTFSSTIVIMKLLSDKKDLDTLYGRISMGFLIVQDIVAMFILIFVASLTGEGSIYSIIAESFVKVVGAIGFVLLIGYYLLPKILKKIADSSEFVMIFCIAWCLALATALHHIGLSIEIGALLAGVSLSISPFRHEIAARIRPLRDFFLLMFFVFLGTQMEFSNFNAYIVPIIIFSIFVLIGNPIIVMALMGISRYTSRTGFLAGLTVAQISEFSLILIALGIKVGHISPDILSLVTVVGLITIGGSTYFIMYGNKIYKYIKHYLSIFERNGNKIDEHHSDQSKNFDAILLGYNHIGLNITETLKKLRKKFLVIDYNPEVINELVTKKIPCMYEDIENDEIFERINIKKIKLAVSSIKNIDINLPLIKTIREVNKQCVIILVTDHIAEAIEYYQTGANYVIVPNELSGDQGSVILEKYGFDIKKFIPLQIKHLEKLHKL